MKNLLWLQALNWLIKPVWILWIERTVQVQLGNEWYGRYFVHFNLGLLFAVLLDAGLNAYVSREVASEGQLINRHRIFKLRLFLGAIYVALVGVFAFQQHLDWRIIGLVVLNQLLASVLLLLRAVIQGKQQFISDGFLSVTDRLVAIVVSAWFLFGSNTFIGLNGIIVFLLAQTVGYVVAVLMGFYLLGYRFTERIESNTVLSNQSSNRYFPENNDTAKTAYSNKRNNLVDENHVVDLTSDVSNSQPNQLVNRNSTNDEAVVSNGPALASGVLARKEWSKQVFWYVAMALFMSVFTRVDALMIRNLSPDMFGIRGMDSGYFQAGLYAQSYRLLDAGLIFSTLLSTQLLPLFSRQIAQNESSQSLIWIAFRLVWLVGVSALFTAVIFGESLLELLYGAKWVGGPETAWAKQSYFIFIGLMGAFVAMSSIHVFGTFITARGKMKWLTLLALGVMVLNLMLNYVFIPNYGALGAAYSACLTQGVFALACMGKVWASSSWSWKGIKWKIIPMSVVFIGLLILSHGNFPKIIGNTTLSWVTWILGIGGLVWMLFGKDIAHMYKNRKTFMN